MDDDHQRQASSPTTSPQFAVLNYFFPGFSVLGSAAHAYLGADIAVFLPALLAVVGVAIVWHQVHDSLWSLVDDHFMSSVRIRTDDEVYNMVMLWLSRQRFAHNSRHFFANTDIKSRSRCLYRYRGSDDDGFGTDDDDDDGSQKQALHYTPAFGTHLFWYKSRPLILGRHQNREQLAFDTTSDREELSLSCFGRSPWILKQLLLEACQMHRSKDEHKTLIYRGNLAEAYWQRCMSRLNRPFSTVILNEAVKQALLDDAADYLDPMTRRWYANRGIPYRRGYLFHGPPGTGKSSLSLALAGYFRMKIYIVSLSSAAATEENITTLFNELPTRCIVLLEDIDSAGLTHTRDNASAVPDASAAAHLATPPIITPGAAPRAPQTPQAGGRLSLSGLLNILDGVASQEGRILIMTTNHIEKLDGALIRPGRIDMMIPFGLADADMTLAIFRAIYAPYDNESTFTRSHKPTGAAKAKDGHDSSEAEEGERDEERASIRERVHVLSKRFAAKIPELEFSPAEIQGLLLRHKRNPEEAIEAAAGWVARTRKDREEKAAQEAAKRQTEAKAEAGGDAESLKSEPESEATTKRGDTKSTRTGGLESKAGTELKNATDSGYETP